jgi:hypothetical protein
MVDPQSALIGAGAVYTVLVHMAVVYLFATLRAERAQVSASEADVLSEGGS